MNKKSFITIMFALVTVAGQAQTKNYTIQGNLSEVAKATAKQGVSFITHYHRGRRHYI